jgi:CBS-domain-containing membrane protein
MSAARSPQADPDPYAIAIAGAGVLITALVLDAFDQAIFLAPFATAAVVIGVLPMSDIAQPRSIVGGSIAGAAVGLLLGTAFTSAAIGPAIAAVAAMLVMYGTRTLHPPALATAILAYQHADQPWDSFAAITLAAVVTVVCATVMLRLHHERAYPARWF